MHSAFQVTLTEQGLVAFKKRCKYERTYDTYLTHLIYRGDAHDDDLLLVVE